MTDAVRERRNAVGSGREYVSGAPIEAVLDHTADEQRTVQHFLPEMRGNGRRLGLALRDEEFEQVVFRPGLRRHIVCVQDALDLLGIENSAVVARPVRAVGPGLVEKLGEATPIGPTQRFMGKVIVVADQLAAPPLLQDVEARVRAAGVHRGPDLDARSRRALEEGGELPPLYDAELDNGIGYGLFDWVQLTQCHRPSRGFAE